MNLQDLRDELAARAATSDDRPADLLPGVRTKIRRTRRRRIITAASTAAVAVAVAATILPGTLTNSSPDPAEPPYTQNGYTIPGEHDGEPLLKGWAGKTGENQVEFDWTPTTKEISFIGLCRNDSQATVWVRVNGFTVDRRPCVQDLPVNNGGLGQSALWADAPIGRPAKVTLALIGDNGRPVHDAGQQLGVGIYADPTADGPAQWGPAQPGDYGQEGLRFRQQVGRQTRLAATIGDRGAMRVSTSFVAPSRSVVVQTLGTPADYVATNDVEYRIQVLLSDGNSVNGYAANGDQAQLDTSQPIQLAVPAGKRVQVTARLVDKFGTPLSVPKARIGVAIYDPGPQITQRGIDFDREKEVDGTRYRFVRAYVIPASDGQAQLTTPVGKPFLWVYGNTNLGPGVRTRWTGLTADQDGPPASSGFGWATEAAQTEPKLVTYQVRSGRPTGGELAIALYLPVT